MWPWFLTTIKYYIVLLGGMELLSYRPPSTYIFMISVHLPVIVPQFPIFLHSPIDTDTLFRIEGRAIESPQRPFFWPTDMPHWPNIGHIGLTIVNVSQCGLSVVGHIGLRCRPH